MKKAEALERARIAPERLRCHEGLYALYALQHYESFGAEYAPNVFYNQLFGILAGVRNSSRKTLLKALASPACTVCQVPVDLAGSVLDHVIPLSRGGADSLENTMPLCKQHNSSKGAKDLLEWWLSKGWEAQALPRNMLAVYCRLMWAHLGDRGLLHSAAPPYLRAFLTEWSAGLETDAHRLALYGATYAAMAFVAWETRHGCSDVR